MLWVLKNTLKYWSSKSPSAGASFGAFKTESTFVVYIKVIWQRIEGMENGLFLIRGVFVFA